MILALREDTAFVPARVDINCDDAGDDFGRLLEHADAPYGVEFYAPDDALRQKLLGQNLSILGLC